MQDIFNNPTTMKNASYLSSGGLSLFGIISLQNAAIIIGIFFTILTWWISYRATKSRRKEEMQRHNIEVEYLKARQLREEQQHSLALSLMAKKHDERKN